MDTQTTNAQPTAVARPSLLAILRVEPAQRVACHACNHGVYAQIHVVGQAGTIQVYGSDCFSKLFGNRDALGSASYGGAEARMLTQEERDMLANNTADLIAQFEQERMALALAALERDRAVLAARQQREIQRELDQIAKEEAKARRESQVAALRPRALRELSAKYQLSERQLLGPGWAGLVEDHLTKLLAESAHEGNRPASPPHRPAAQPIPQPVEKPVEQPLRRQAPDQGSLFS